MTIDYLVKCQRLKVKKFAKHMEQPFQRAQATVAVESASPVIKFRKGDAIASVALGLIIGFFTPFILNNIGRTLPLQDFYFVIFPIVALMGMWIVFLIAARVPVLVQITKFGAIGAANTVIDFGILNFLSFKFQIFSGGSLTILNIISFSVAVINSYFWNKHWTFKSEQNNSSKQFIEFIVVSVIGVLINTGIVYLMTTLVIPFAGISEQIWLNIGKLMATFISLAWNFAGYKFIVFRK
ncbi:MAG: Membrane protein, GtrA superfamily [Parcubacteria group bacterium GW2011_GWD2_38_12]|nr:MAG: Membrane protein, GtrA superfamily [Parcubacteria group bacterium GW2011_GWC2_36_17]KKQ43922.1 MAG: Membrane protein, GtrA superfamily [Parcubacteria group bacterium GW2011_GWE2_37_8]KKQ52852.1 MAG: Membrane protein, GtrA superfamily [Parcubacteria group bacterium GW2011_GWD2_38_12]KKQ59055.1 MAG: Membrane protein, GtrA superfamily [Parcubacteria group bacterium GW2011_GWC1_38_17]KKQ59670.1 MAG: Membrane protein, GtrA superfamily [Parcubacteria group bacterium GW2011_GWD1_38_16]